MVETSFGTKELAAWRRGVEDTQKHILEALAGYFELTQMPDEHGVFEEDPSWDKGYQAAMAIVKNSYNLKSLLDTIKDD